MSAAPRIALTTALTLAAFLGPLSAPAASTGGLFISSYWPVSWRFVTPTVIEYTLRATLTNVGAPVPGATATAASASPGLVLVDGSVTFGPVGTYRTVISTDTFTIRHDCTQGLQWPFLRWTIAPPSANGRPLADAGADFTRRVTELATLDGAGDYVAQLTVNDGFVNSAPDTVLVRAANPPPAIVTIEATEASAAEGGGGGLFTISRSGDTARSLTVNFLVIGTAANGTDYQALDSSVTILAGASTATSRSRRLTTM